MRSHYNWLSLLKRGAAMTTTLTITSQGQIALPKELLTHLGVQAGDKVELALLPGGRAEIVATQPLQLHGPLEGKANGEKLSIEEINEAIAQAAKRLGALGGSAPGLQAIPRRRESEQAWA